LTPAIVCESLADYRRSAQHLVAKLRAARPAEDFQQAGALALRLKSSSRSVGATALGDLCAELENAARAGTRSLLSQNVARLEAELATVDARSAELLAQG
jgi:HPt (histidine-containing phosphotransfer) domain-containing protein